MDATDKRIAELEAQIRNMLAAGVGTAASSDADWLAMDLEKYRSDDPTTRRLFGVQHRYDIVEGSRVFTVFDPEYGAAMLRNGCHPYIDLPTKRREIALLLRDGFAPSPPAWWNQVLTPANHNAGIKAEIIRLEAEIAKLAKLMIE